jgi:hypothetical protein
MVSTNTLRSFMLDALTLVGLNASSILVDGDRWMDK